MNRFSLSELPPEWISVPLGVLADVVYGKSLTAQLRNSSGDIPVYASAGVVGTHNEALHNGPSIVIGRKGTVGAIYYVSTPFWCIDTAFYLDNIKPIVDMEFLARALEILNLSRLSIVVGVPVINRKDIESQTILLPPLPEQRRIVEILRQADELRSLRRQADEKTKELLPALFEEVFGSPSEWIETSPLRNFVDFAGGGTPSRKVARFFTGDIPWATSRDIKSRYLNDAQEHITEEATEKSATKLVPPKTILMVVKSKIPMPSLPMSITTRSFCFGQDIKGLVCKPGVEPESIVAVLTLQTKYILDRARGVNTEGLTLEVLRKIPVPTNLIEKQKDFLSQINLYNQIEQDWLSSDIPLTTLFNLLLTQAFTGELTEQWREENKEELIAAAEERDQLLQISFSRSVSGERAVFSKDDVADSTIITEDVTRVIEEAFVEEGLSFDSLKTFFLSTLTNEQPQAALLEDFNIAMFTAEDFDIENNSAQRLLEAMAGTSSLLSATTLTEDIEEEIPHFVSAFRVLAIDDEARTDFSSTE